MICSPVTSTSSCPLLSGKRTLLTLGWHEFEGQATSMPQRGATRRHRERRGNVERELRMVALGVSGIQLVALLGAAAR